MAEHRKRESVRSVCWSMLGQEYENHAFVASPPVRKRGDFHTCGSNTAGKVNNCCCDLLRQTNPAKRDKPQKQIEEFLTQRHTRIHHGNAESLLCVRPSHGFDPCSRNGNLYSYRRRSHAGKAGLYQSKIRIGRIKNGWEAIPIHFVSCMLI